MSICVASPDDDICMAVYLYFHEVHDLCCGRDQTNMDDILDSEQTAVVLICSARRRTWI